MKENIVLICDDNYAMPTAVTIKSIIENANMRCSVNVFTVELSKTNIDMLERLSNDKVTVIVHKVDVEKYKDKLDKINQKTHVSPAALIKFELCNLFPSNVKSVLYIDSDIIIKDSLEKLFKLDLEGYLLAASFEFWNYVVNIRENSDYSVPNFYFNSGVMLMNLEEFRKNNISTKLWEEKIRQSQDPKNKSLLMDQDVFNTICSKKCKPLDIMYNFNPQFSRNELVRIEWINKIYHSKYNSVDQLFDDAHIIHYVGKEDKPWKYLSGMYRELWDKYYVKAGFDLKLLKRKNIKHGVRFYYSRLVYYVKKNGIVGMVKYLKNNYL